MSEAAHRFGSGPFTIAIWRSEVILGLPARVYDDGAVWFQTEDGFLVLPPGSAAIFESMRIRAMVRQ